MIQYDNYRTNQQGESYYSVVDTITPCARGRVQVASKAGHTADVCIDDLLATYEEA